MTVPVEIASVTAVLAIAIVIRTKSVVSLVNSGSPVARLAVVVTVILENLVPVFDVSAAPVAVIAISRLRFGNRGKEKQSTQRCSGQRCLTEQRLPQMRMPLHTSSSGASLVLVGVVCVLSIETPWREKGSGKRKFKKSRGAAWCAAPGQIRDVPWFENSALRAITVVIVVAVIPVVLGAPAVPVFIPPAVSVSPAILACFVQFMTSVVRLLALPAMMLDGFMKTMIGPCDTSLAIVVSAQTRCAGEQQEPGQRGTCQRQLCRSK
jgi:hypothetical protein